MSIVGLTASTRKKPTLLVVTPPRVSVARTRQKYDASESSGDARDADVSPVTATSGLVKAALVDTSSVYVTKSPLGSDAVAHPKSGVRVLIRLLLPKGLTLNAAGAPLAIPVPSSRTNNCGGVPLLLIFSVSTLAPGLTGLNLTVIIAVSVVDIVSGKVIPPYEKSTAPPIPCTISAICNVGPSV